MIQLNSVTVLHSASADEGASWTPPAPTNISSAFSSQLPGCGHGIVVDGALCSEPTCGGTAGRVTMPFVCHAAGASPFAAPLSAADVACPGCYSCLVWSDDHGVSWHVGAASTQDGTRESGVVQLLKPGARLATLYASERNMGADPGHRLHAVSVDSGASYSVFGADPGLPDVDTKNWTGVVAGVARFDTPGAHLSVMAPPPRALSASAILPLTLHESPRRAAHCDNDPFSPGGPCKPLCLHQPGRSCDVVSRGHPLVRSSRLLGRMPAQRLDARSAF
jgi:hypothetical protein